MYFTAIHLRTLFLDVLSTDPTIEPRFALLVLSIPRKGNSRSTKALCFPSHLTASQTTS